MNNEKFQELVLQQFNRINERLDSLENRQHRMETRMENEVIDKIKALFDDREVKNDRFDRIEDRLGSIENDTRYLVAKVVRLEKMAK